jgi:hypothetical protein
MKINEFKIIKELGRGSNGVVYLIKNEHNEEYAMKNKKIVNWDELENQLLFIKEIKKYPNFFSQLKDYEIHKNTKNEFYIKEIYSLIDGSLMSIFNNISLEAKKSLLIQLLYSFYLMLNVIKIINSDANPDNICYIKTNKKYIYLNIKGKRIKLETYGYLIQLIDYDYVIPLYGDLYEKYLKGMKNIDYYNNIIEGDIKIFTEKYLMDYVDLFFGEDSKN